MDLEEGTTVRFLAMARTSIATVQKVAR